MIGRKTLMRICKTTEGSSYLKRMEHLAKKLADRKVRQVEATTTTQKLKPRLMQEKQYERKKSG
jgi:primosomal protein N''